MIRFFLALLATLCLTSVTSAQTLRFPPTGQNFTDMGKGDPVIVLEYGLASSLREWMPTARVLAAQSRVFAYDRRGYGSARLIGTKRGAKEIAEELHDLLESLKIEGPYVLVGHSLGALYIQAFAKLYPEDTAGLLLVDPSIKQLDYFMAGEVEETEMPLMTLVFGPGAKAEWRGRRQAVLDLEELGDLPEVPMTVLSAGNNMHGEYDDLQEQVTALQGSLIAGRKLARHVVAPHAGHNLHKEATRYVEIEVARLVALARAKATEKAD